MRTLPSTICVLAISVCAVGQTNPKSSYTPPRLADGKPDLNGIWEVRGKADADLEGKIGGKNVIVDPANGKIPYKPEALAKKKELNAQRATADPVTKCWMQGVPRIMYAPYPFRIAQAADQPVIAILSQYVHTVRNINMGGEHLDGLDLWLGDSRGHWEGDTLVVDVADFNDMTWFDGAGSHHSGMLHVVEHFTRTGPETITYEATITDPMVLTKPFKMSLPLSLHTEKNFQIMEYECYAIKEGPTVTVGDKRRILSMVDKIQTAAALLILALPAAAQGPGRGPVNPLLNGNPYVSPQEVKGGPIVRLPDGKPDLQGAWSQRTAGNSMSMFSVEKTAGHPETSIPRTAGVIVDPSDGVIPYQPGMREKQIDLGENHMIEESDAHCFLGGLPHQMYTPFGMRILQPPGFVVMTWEFMHAYRIIPLDGRPHIDSSVKLYEGDSRGHWEGDTLVIDVTNQVGRTWLDQSANFHSDAIHVVERITPIDSNNLRYEATIEDPKVYTRPWTISFFFSRILDKNFEHLEFACIEGEVDLGLKQ